MANDDDRLREFVRRRQAAQRAVDNLLGPKRVTRERYTQARRAAWLDLGKDFAGSWIRTPNGTMILSFTGDELERLCAAVSELTALAPSREQLR